jgi:mannan endo-1,4-beta-mannosidase
MQRSIGFFLFYFLVFIVVSCTPEEPGDSTSPTLMSASPADTSIDVDVNAKITLEFTEKIVVAANAQIKLNNEMVLSTASARTISITTSAFISNTQYTLVVADNSLSDVAGNFVKAFSITFKTAAAISETGTVFEAENAALTGDAAISTSSAGYSGTGFVNTNSGNVTFTIQALQTGYYTVWMRYMVNSAKTNDLYVDGKAAAAISFAATNRWTDLKVATLRLSAGSHTIALVKNWGYIQLDYLKINYDPVGPAPFNIAASLVTPNPSTQAVNLYNFLKTNFGNKIISGTTANHSTNIDEATWVYTNTGKWPALTNFDFIDHTWPNQNWVKYTAAFTLGKEWWNNNGIVSLMWHWRDPLTKSGDFYTEKTSFDVSKISDVNSPEYKAMISDIDLIAGYLKQFKEANIPVIWRPLHEAEGAWFWWGAKGAEPCKALWKLMFDRLVNYHGLNNLIWLWTTSASGNAATWYPGDNYVDILAMDIYPGANQHGSQYISFNKVREFSGGRKIITLSECGSVPDPVFMIEYGDTWSWFMPWNGDYTRSDSHNGVNWWKKFFSYDFVITRDKMPNLK